MAEPLQVPALPDGAISEWRPTRKTLLAWTILGTPISVVAWFGYTLVALHGEIPTSATIGFGQIALIVGLGWVHEGVHGVFVVVFGAKPQYGILKIGGIPAGLYTTAAGHRFGRLQYLILCLAPLLVLAPLGVPACLLPFGAYLAFPFAIHLAGCIGDVTIAWHVLRAPPDVVCEDMRDGLRLWPAEA